MRLNSMSLFVLNILKYNKTRNLEKSLEVCKDGYFVSSENNEKVSELIKKEILFFPDQSAGTGYLNKMRGNSFYLLKDLEDLLDVVNIKYIDKDLIEEYYFCLNFLCGDEKAVANAGFSKDFGKVRVHSHNNIEVNMGTEWIPIKETIPLHNQRGLGLRYIEDCLSNSCFDLFVTSSNMYGDYNA